jgi:hypothetical protein
MTLLQTEYHLTTAWAGIVPVEDGAGYMLLGCRPGEKRPFGRLPNVTVVTGRTPLQAYKELVGLTGQPWCLAMRESDLINLDGAHWTQMVQGIPRIKLVSDQLWIWAEPIWEDASEDLPASLDRSRALWLALTAAQDEEQLLREESVPF